MSYRDTPEGEALVAEGIRLREERGLSIGQIASRLGGAASTWHCRFISRGIERNGVPQHRPVSRPFDEQIKRLRARGHSFAAIGREIGRSREYVQHRAARIARQEAWDEAYG